jgi:2',3'-cyclic-nucleotide 2'-phosphodiesterase (5'-nucleotidase family)
MAWWPRPLPPFVAGAAPRPPEEIPLSRHARVGSRWRGAVRGRLAALPLWALLAACAGTAGAGPEAGPLHIRVLAIHDFHGSLQPQTYPWSEGRQVGGAPALRAAMDSAEARCACPTFRLDGGDQLQGTLESNLVHGQSVVQALNLLGLDAAAIGNHELDWGVDTLRARLAEARYAWLAANVFLRGTDRRPDWAAPYAIVERQGVRVAVIGWATMRTPGTLRAATTAPYEFRDVAGIRDVLAAVRRYEPDFTIIAAHAGGDCRAGDCRGEMADLARALEPGTVHLIVGGHDHTAGTGVVNGIPIVRSSSHGRAISVVDLVRNADGTRDFRMSRDTVWNDRVQPDTAMQALIAPYVALAESIARTPVATLRDSLYTLDSPALGNLITDAIRATAAADLSMHNPGGIRANLDAGLVTFDDLFRVLPFGNALVRVTLTGAELRQVLERALPRYYFSGATILHDPDAPAGRRLRSLRFDDGRTLRDDETYSFATSDFIAAGGDGFTMLIDRPTEHLGITLLDAFIEHLRSLPQPVTAPATPRVRRAG